MFQAAVYRWPSTLVLEQQNRLGRWAWLRKLKDTITCPFNWLGQRMGAGLASCGANWQPLSTLFFTVSTQ